MADLKISQLTNATTPLAGTEVLPIVQSSTTTKVTVANVTAGRDVAAKSFAASSATTDFTNIDLTNTSTGGVSYRMASGGQFGYFDIPTGAFAIRDLTNSATRAYWTTAGNQVLPNGNLVIGTAGKGIDFSANTHAAGMTSELLDWYEEGAWTPSLFDSEGNALTIGTAVGRYTRVGNVVTLTCSVSWTGLGSANASPLLLAGLPFASVNVANLNQSGTIGFMSGIDTVLGTKQITANLPLNASFFTFRQTNDNAAPTDLAANSCSATGEIRLSATYIV